MEFLNDDFSDDSESECEFVTVRNKQEDQFVHLTETFDQHKLNHILENQYLFKKHMRPNCFENNYNPFTILNKYLMKSRNGVVKTEYKQNNGFGRFYAVKSISMQSMPREIRHTLAKDLYADIDVVNAHPVILMHLCKNKDMSPKILNKYIKNREKMLERLKVDRETGKTLILSMINGGKSAYESLVYKPKFLIEFKKEIEIIHKMFSMDDAFEKHKDERECQGYTKNHRASYLNTLLCDFENRILQCMYEFLGNPEDAVMCFDGIMIRKDGLEAHDLKACEKHINDTLGIKLELKEKPMTDGFDINDGLLEIPKYEEPQTALYTDFESFVNKEIYVDILDEWCNNSIVLINNGGNHFLLTKNKRVDSMTKETSIYYKQVSERTLMNNLRVNVKVINDKFDYKFLNENCDKKIKGRVRPEDRIKMKKYVYEFIGSNVPNRGDGYLENAIMTRTMVSRNNVEFYPYLKRKGEPKLYDCFNIFTGFPLENVPLTLNDKFENSLLYKHLGDEMMNGDVGEFNHFLDHIADMIQMPHLIRGPSHLFYTSPGMGKGMMAIFMGRLLGQDHVITFADVSTYFGNFNSEQANKILKIFEEVSEKGDAFHKHDRLKGDQTKTHDRIEPKGIDAYNIRHCARYWYYTNHESALFIENNDRRHTMHRSNNRMANKTEYFNKLWGLVHDDGFCRMVFEYFAKKKYTEKSVLTAYETKYKREQKLTNLPNGIKFLIDLIENNFEGAVRQDDKITAKSLSLCFREWCTENGTKYNLNALKSQIKRLGIEDGKNGRVQGTISKCYVINVDNMRKNFREFLKDEHFDFDIVPIDLVIQDQGTNSDEESCF